MNEKNVMVLRRDSTKRLFLISLKLKQHVGALSDITRILAVRGIDVLEGHVSSQKGRASGVATFFVESTRPGVDKDMMEQLLKASSFVESVEIAEGNKGLMIDTVNFPVTWEAGGRVILLQTEALKQMFTTASAKYGKEVEEMLFKLGSDYGTEMWKAAFAGVPNDPKSVEYHLGLFNALGLGRMTISRYKPQTASAKVSVEHSFECEGRASASPTSHFLRGTLAGSLGVVLGREVAVTETQCIATGEKTCEFEVSSKNNPS